MSKISILIADKDDSVSEFLTKYLQMFTHDIYVTDNGNDALDYYKKNYPNIIFTDINLVGLNGIDLIKQIRKEDTYTEIAILTEDTNIDNMVDAIKLNLAEYQFKPIQNKNIYHTFQEIHKRLESKRLINLGEGFKWDKNCNILLEKNEKINLTNYETLLLKRLIQSINQCITYEDIHFHVYAYEEFSQNAITSLVKRLRKKLPKGLIKACYKEGYKLFIQ